MNWRHFQRESLEHFSGKVESGFPSEIAGKAKAKAPCRQIHPAKSGDDINGADWAPILGLNKGRARSSAPKHARFA
jgi:hypothetical protein